MRKRERREGEGEREERGREREERESLGAEEAVASSTSFFLSTSRQTPKPDEDSPPARPHRATTTTQPAPRYTRQARKQVLGCRRGLQLARLGVASLCPALPLPRAGSHRPAAPPPPAHLPCLTAECTAFPAAPDHKFGGCVPRFGPSNGVAGCPLRSPPHAKGGKWPSGTRWSLLGHPATPLVSVGLNTLSVFVFCTDNCDHVHSAVISRPGSSVNKPVYNPNIP